MVLTDKNARESSYYIYELHVIHNRTISRTPEEQIMVIPRHKPANSLSIYKRVSSDKKLAMGMSMSYYIQVNNPMIYVPPPPMPIGASNLRSILPAEKCTNTTTDYCRPFFRYRSFCSSTSGCAK